MLRSPCLAHEWLMLCRLTRTLLKAAATAIFMRHKNSNARIYFFFLKNPFKMDSKVFQRCSIHGKQRTRFSFSIDFKYTQLSEIYCGVCESESISIFLSFFLNSFTFGRAIHTLADIALRPTYTPPCVALDLADRF